MVVKLFNAYSQFPYNVRRSDRRIVTFFHYGTLCTYLLSYLLTAEFLVDKYL